MNPLIQYVINFYVFKVHFLSSRNQFVVKTRLHPDFEPAKKKKNVKRSKKNKRNNEGGKFDPQRID
jgi:hypothetical protein